MTEEQLERLAAEIIDTAKNVHSVCEELFGIEEFSDENWHKMCKQEGIFKCEYCGQWMGKTFQSCYNEDQCEGCVEDGEEE